jgi:hypothetical protein
MSVGFVGRKAVMATITFNTADHNEQVREQIRTALAAYREMLDIFVGNPVAEEAEHARPRQPPNTTSPSKNAQ